MKHTIHSLFAVVALICLTGCKKSVEKENNSTPPVDPQPPIVVGCTASKTAAENIMIFPADNPWNKDISTAPIDPYNADIIAGFATNGIKADFGSGLWEGAPIGIPYVVVCGNQPKIGINFTDYGDESDAGPYPIPLTAPIEGNGNGDSHVIAVDIENGKLYELFNAHVASN